MITLQPFKSSDFDRLISWVDSPETLVQFAGPDFTFPLNHEQLQKYLDNNCRHPYKIANTSTNEVIGHAEIFLPDENTAIICRILIGDKNNRGKGTGQQIVKQLLEIAFNDFKVEKVELNVFDWNTSAVKCYEKVGFKINPEKVRKREVNGKIWIALNMVIRKNDFKN